MSQNDSLADNISKINNASKALKGEVVLKRSNLLLKVLDKLNQFGYVGSYEIIEDGKQGLVRLNLINTINKCGVVKPRFPVKVDEIEKYERRYLPAKDFGIVIVSTPEGLLTQKDVVKKNIGGRLVAYCY